MKRICKTKAVPVNKNIIKQCKNSMLRFYSIKNKNKSMNEQKTKHDQEKTEAILSDIFLKPKLEPKPIIKKQVIRNLQNNK